MPHKNLEGELNETELIKEVIILVGIAAADSLNIGKTCIPIPLSRNSPVKDGDYIFIRGKGYVYITRNGPDNDSPLECNFYPEFSGAYEIRRNNNENYSDRIKNSKFKSAGRIPSLSGTIPRKVYGVSRQ